MIRQITYNHDEFSIDCIGLCIPEGDDYKVIKVYSTAEGDSYIRNRIISKAEYFYIEPCDISITKASIKIEKKYPEDLL